MTTLAEFIEAERTRLQSEFEVLKARNAQLRTAAATIQAEMERNVVRMHELRGAFDVLVKLEAIVAAGDGRGAQKKTVADRIRAVIGPPKGQG